MIVGRPGGGGGRGGGFVLSPETPGILRVVSLIVLGLVFGDTLSFDPHMDVLSRRAAQSMYALKILRSHGLTGDALWGTTQATLLASLLYASPAWWGPTSAGSRDRLESIMRRLIRNGYKPTDSPTFSELCERADGKLFNDIQMNSDHVLHTLLPPIKSNKYSLRPRRHNFEGANYSTLMRKNSIHRLILN